MDKQFKGDIIFWHLDYTTHMETLRAKEKEAKRKIFLKKISNVI